MKQNTVFIQVENYTAQESISGETSVSVTGLALPFNKVSRNGFTYIKESIEQTYKTLEGKPVLFNHNAEKPIGHVVSVELREDGMYYEMDLDPEEAITRKLRRGDIKNVSIQCMYDETGSYIDDDGVTNAYIQEFLELSVVTLPGFVDTTAQVMEKLKENISQEPAGIDDEEKWAKAKQLFKDQYDQEPVSKKDFGVVMGIYKKLKGDEQMSKEETQPEEKKEEVKEPSKEPVEEPSKDPVDETAEEKVSKESEEDPMAKMESRMKAMEDKLAEVCKKMEMGDEEKKEEQAKEEPEEDPEEEDKKRQEAINKDKKTVATEHIEMKPPKQLTTKDLKEKFKEIM